MEKYAMFLPLSSVCLCHSMVAKIRQEFDITACDSLKYGLTSSQSVDHSRDRRYSWFDYRKSTNKRLFNIIYIVFLDTAVPDEIQMLNDLK